MGSNINWLETFVAWAPMLLLIGVWIYFMRSMGGGGMSYGKYLEQHLAEARRHNELMMKLVEKMDARITRLETADRGRTGDT